MHLFRNAALGLVLGASLLHSGCDWEEADFPAFLAVDAWCDPVDPEHPSVGQEFHVEATVDHEQGPGHVSGVWVEASFLDYTEDGSEAIVTYIATIDLERQEALAGDDDDSAAQEEELSDQWEVAVTSGVSLLDCAHPGDYYFFFTAEDAEGQQSYADLIN